MRAMGKIKITYNFVRFIHQFKGSHQLDTNIIFSLDENSLMFNFLISLELTIPTNDNDYEFGLQV